MEFVQLQSITMHCEAMVKKIFFAFTHCNLCNCNFCILRREAATKKSFLYLHPESCAITILLYVVAKHRQIKFLVKRCPKPIDFVSRSWGATKYTNTVKRKQIVENCFSWVLRYERIYIWWMNFYDLYFSVSINKSRAS